MPDLQRLRIIKMWLNNSFLGSRFRDNIYNQQEGAFRSTFFIWDFQSKCSKRFVNRRASFIPPSRPSPTGEGVRFSPLGENTKGGKYLIFTSILPVPYRSFQMHSMPYRDVPFHVRLKAVLLSLPDLSGQPDNKNR
jgi:hypothetical protein